MYIYECTIIMKFAIFRYMVFRFKAIIGNFSVKDWFLMRKKIGNIGIPLLYLARPEGSFPVTSCHKRLAMRMLETIKFC